MKSLIIKEGLVVDGTGGQSFKGDVAIEDGIITEVGKLPSNKVSTVIDAQNQVIAPGFIDMHCHADFSLPILPTANSLVHQGITTAVTGQCGLSPAPLLERHREEIIAALSNILEGIGIEMPWEEWSSFGEYLNFLDRMGISINIAPLVGQGMIRGNIMGFAAGRANPNQMEQMRSEITKAIDEGSIGLSTGLIYPPGSYASTDELIELTHVVGKHNSFYFSHIRGEAETLLDAVAEAIQIGRETGAPVQISHFKAAGHENWDKSAEALKMIDQAIAKGIDISTDMYPYTAGSTVLVTILPEWAQEGGKKATLKRLNDPSMRAKMKHDMETSGFAKSLEWDTVLINGSPRQPKYQGHFVMELANESGQTPHEWIFNALFETELQMVMTVFAMSEDNRRLEMKHPAMTFGTDGMGLAEKGPLAKNLPHPRNYGTFARILGRYVREEGVLTLEEAIHKMTGLAAKRLRLTDRGFLRPGLAADLVVFDPATVNDKSTYEEPHQYPEGISQVLVNGRLVVEDGVHTQARPGRILKRS